MLSFMPFGLSVRLIYSILNQTLSYLLATHHGKFMSVGDKGTNESSLSLYLQNR
jgi:hypothetical protein